MKAVTAFVPRSTTLGAGGPSAATIAAGVFLTACEVVNALVVTGTPAETAIATVIAAAAAFGIQPLFGPALTNLLHIPSQLLFVIASGIAGVNGLVAALSMSTLAHAVVGGALTLVGAVLFGSPVLTAPSPAPTPVPAPVPPAA